MSSQDAGSVLILCFKSRCWVLNTSLPHTLAAEVLALEQADAADDGADGDDHDADNPAAGNGNDNCHRQSAMVQQAIATDIGNDDGNGIQQC